MRIVWFDVDTLRADHLGCYGYPRDTSPAVDALATGGVRFERCYASDVPCLPSRTALQTGRFGIRNGVVSHGGVTAEPIPDGPSRGFHSDLARTSFAMRLRGAGLRTATISSFAERHSAFHWCAGYHEVINPGKMGLETADEIFSLARDWIRRNAARDGWFLHVHFWDPHTPYRTPADRGEPFAGTPAPAWIDESVRARHWELPGPHSAQEMLGFQPAGMWAGRFARQPEQASSAAEVRRMFDGYDVGVRYADEHIGRLVDELRVLGVADETAFVVSSDHGETLGELGVYCDHHTADEHVSHVPMVLRWPGLAPGVAPGLVYQIDVAATLLQLTGQRVPRSWDGVGFADALRAGEAFGRESLVLSQGAWTAQRSVRFGDWLCIRTYHDGYHAFPDMMLFDVRTDPHEQRDLAAQRPDVVASALARLEEWHAAAMNHSRDGIDPLWRVIREGGPWHVRGQLPTYLDRLRKTGREQWADRLASKHPEAASTPA